MVDRGTGTTPADLLAASCGSESEDVGLSEETPKRARLTLQDLLRTASALDAMPELPKELVRGFLEDAAHYQGRRKRIQRRAQVAACREMIQLMPPNLPDPESIAEEAYETFSRSLGTSYSEQDAKYMGGRLRHAKGVLAKALGQLNYDMANLPEIDYALISVEALKHDIDLNRLFHQLQVLEKIAVNTENVNPLGRPKDHNTAAALDAAQYLMDHGIKRQRAAKIVAVLTQHHPDVEAKGWRTIQTAMVDAGIPARTKKLGKGGRSRYISLTPG